MKQSLNIVFDFWWSTDHANGSSRVDVTALLVGIISAAVAVLIIAIMIWYFCQGKYKSNFSRGRWVKGWIVFFFFFFKRVPVLIVFLLVLFSWSLLKKHEFVKRIQTLKKYDALKRIWPQDVLQMLVSVGVKLQQSKKTNYKKKCHEIFNMYLHTVKNMTHHILFLDLTGLSWILKDQEIKFKDLDNVQIMLL